MSDEVGGETDDGDGDGGRGAAGWVPAAVYASNWKTVLAVDAAMGLAVFAAGVVVMIVWNLVGGAGMAALGLVYTLLVVRRARRWAAWRREAGL